MRKRLMHKMQSIGEFYADFLAWCEKTVDSWGYDKETTEKYNKLKERAEAATKARRMEEAAEVWTEIAKIRPVDALPPATRKTIDAALDALHAVFSYVCSKYFRAQLDPEVLEAPGGADALLYVLRDGVKYRQEILYRFESGDNRVEFEPLPA